MDAMSWSYEANWKYLQVLRSVYDKPAIKPSVFTMPETPRRLTILDYGGDGQFALMALSHFPNATVYIVSDRLSPEYQDAQRRIPCADFQTDPTRFDFIFLNGDLPPDVLLEPKLAEGGRIVSLES